MPEVKTKRNIKPQTPGQMQPQDDDLMTPESVDDDGGDQEGATSDQVTLSMADLEALIQSRVDGAVDGAAAKAVHEYRRGQQSGKAVKAVLPEQSKFDPENMDRAELSKDGWVVPVAFPSDKKRMKG